MFWIEAGAGSGLLDIDLVWLRRPDGVKGWHVPYDGRVFQPDLDVSNLPLTFIVPGTVFIAVEGSTMPKPDKGLAVSAESCASKTVCFTLLF